MKLLKLSFALILLALGWALSTKIQKQRSNSFSDQNSSVKDKKDCKQSPDVIELTPPPMINSRKPKPTEISQDSQPQENLSRQVSPCRRACLEFLRLSINPISVFTCVLMVVGAIQTCAFIKSERAVVTPTEIVLAKEVPAYLKQLEVRIELHNGGKVAANIEHLIAAISHGPLPEEPPYSQAQPFVMSPILPGGKGATIMSFLTEWGEDYTTAFKKGTKPLFLFGKVQYRDELSDVWFFGRIRETGFCYYYRPTGGVKESLFETCQYPAYTYTR